MSKELSTEPIVLSHEMMILDAFLKEGLDQSRMDEITNNLINDLLAELGMEKLGRLEIYPAADLRAPGWSFIQPITTSHISGHYFIEPDGNNPNIHMDFYSCKHFSWKQIIPIIDKHLALAKWHADFLYRKDVRAERSIWEISGEGAMVILDKRFGSN
ncbi:hypothetical protein K8942_01335 [Candidatus Peribacteria bacterium]|nr:MAG: hypothetical protein K8942_01335 [Candidatus Peribacteria bacterium]